MNRKPRNPALKTATCAALIAASFAVPVNADALQSIERYCTSSWRQAGIPTGDWDDCTQDTMLELLSRLPPQKLTSAIERPKSTERRELIRSIWCVAQRWRRAVRRAPVPLDVLPDCADDVAAGAALDGDAEALENALGELGSTQQDVLTLWAEGNSIAEIAEQLDVPAARVSDQKYKAIRTLRQKLAESGSADV